MRIHYAEPSHTSAYRLRTDHGGYRSAERLEKMGMEKGKEEEKIRVYKKLIEKGFSEQEAQEITELPKPLEV